MATPLLRAFLSPNPNPKRFLHSTTKLSHPHRLSPHVPLHTSSDLSRVLHIRAKAVEIRTSSDSSSSQTFQNLPSPVLLEVSGMMCGACAARVKGILSADDRVESAAVNMVTETAVVLLRNGTEVEEEERGDIGEKLAKRLTDCGFPAKRRRREVGVRENVRKWKEMVSKKEALLQRSRNKVAFAWTLVALCCGAHASHILHSVGIHVSHGAFWEVLHNSYVKCGIAMVSLLGPGRDILLDGLRAMTKRSPNMNSLVGFGSIAAFFISAISLLNPGLQWDASFFDEPVMLLGFVLLGRSLEEKARIKASSDMNELLGKVVAGTGFVDESMLTGESLPVFKETGLSVSSGTVNWVISLFSSVSFCCGNTLNLKNKTTNE